MKNNGNLILLPTNGLANRLRIIASSLKLSRECNKNLSIYWDNNVGLGASFDDLFQPIEELSIQRIPFKYKIWIKMTPFSSKLYGLDKWYLSLFNFDFIFFDSMAVQVWHNKMNLQSEVNKASHILICSGEEINFFDVQDYKLFIPKPVLQKTIENITGRFAVDTIGIHIRATDNEVAKKYSPLYVFEKKMQDEIDFNSNSTFFVATDEEKYQRYLLKKFGQERIFFHNKVFARHIPEGVKDAVIDLFCLSKTSKIYGSYFSSFSDVAARIGNIPLEIIKNEVQN